MQDDAENSDKSDSEEEFHEQLILLNLFGTNNNHNKTNNKNDEYTINCGISNWNGIRNRLVLLA